VGHFNRSLGRRQEVVVCTRRRRGKRRFDPICDQPSSGEQAGVCPRRCEANLLCDLSGPDLLGPGGSVQPARGKKQRKMPIKKDFFVTFFLQV